MSGATDLLAHLRPCAITVDFENVSYTIDALDAVEWIAHLERERPDLYLIFPELAGEEAIEHVEDALWEGRVDSEVIAKLALHVISAAADRPWWVTLRIIAHAKSAWEIVGVNRAAGMSLAGWLDEVWANIMKHIDPKKKAAWVNDIEEVPKGWEQATDFDAEERAFLAAMKAVM